MWGWKRRGGEEGQALLVVLIVVSLLGALGAAMTSLWLRGVTLAQRRADATAALYAAEAGIARGIQELTASGGRTFSLGPEAVGARPFAATYMVSAVRSASGDGAYDLISTGKKGKVARTVRVRLSTPFFYPLYADHSLTIDAGSWWLGKTAIRFSPPAAYGSDRTVTGNVSPDPIRQPMTPPDIPFGTFAEAAGPVPAVRPDLPSSGPISNGWYNARGCDRRRQIKVPAGVVAGIAGNMNCGVVVESGATLVITGNLETHDANVEVYDGGLLVVGGNVDVSSLGLSRNLPVQEGGLVVAGGSVHVRKLAVLGGSTGENALSVLALDRSGCTAAACGPDKSNNIRIDDIAGRLDFGLVNPGSHLELLAYAGPLPGQTPQVSLNFYDVVACNIFPLGSTDLVKVNGTAVSAGNLSLRAGTTLCENTIQMVADPTVMARFASVIPGTALWTQLSWEESVP